MKQYMDLDESVASRLSKGDREAFTLVFRRYNRLLYALSYRYLKAEEEAEDAVQYVFMRIWEERHRLEFHANLRSLLFTILKNYLLNELRHRQVVYEKHYELAQLGEDVEEDLMKRLEDKDFKERLAAAIRQLPPQRRQVCLLKVAHGLTNQEIADKMGISLPTVKSHYTQAVKALRKLLGPLGWLVVALCQAMAQNYAAMNSYLLFREVLS